MLKSGVKIFIFDEPTAALDANARRVVLDAIKSLKTPDKIVIIVSHHKDELQIADRIIKIQKGKMVPEISALTGVADRKEEEDEEKNVIISSPIITSVGRTELSVPLLSNVASQTFSFQPPNRNTTNDSTSLGPPSLRTDGGKNLNSNSIN